jgi:hypothetical protein
VNGDGQLRKHDCRSFDCDTRQWSYGPRDNKERGVVKIAKVKPEFAPEVIEALRTLRKIAWGGDVEDAINILDNAGVFKAIDEATGYDVDPEPVKVSKCTCPGWKLNGLGRVETHRPGCPGDPAEWGDMAYTTAPMRKFSDLTDEELEA